MRGTARPRNDLLSTHALRGLVIAALVAATICVCAPSVLLGDVRQLGMAAGLAIGATVGAVIGCAIGPYLLLRIGDTEYHGGIRVVRHLAGQDLARTSSRYLLHTLGAVCGVVVMTSGATGVGAALDGLGREVLGARAPMEPATASDWHRLVGVLVTCLYLTVLTWLSVIALRSGRRAAIALAVAVATWFLALNALPQGGWSRFLLALHPFAAPWVALDPVPSSTARLPVTFVPVLACALLWLAALGLFASRRVRAMM